MVEMMLHVLWEELTLEPHQSQNRASLWFRRVHLEQVNMLLSAAGTEGVLFPLHPT